MTRPSDWQIGGEWLEWYTELPFYDTPRESPVFLIQNVECYFEFCKNSSDCSYYLYLKSKMKCNELQSFPIIIYSDHSGTTRPGTFSRCCVTFSNAEQSLLYIPYSCFTKREDTLHYGYYIRFCFIFRNGIGSLLPLEKKSGKSSFCIRCLLCSEPD